MASVMRLPIWYVGVRCYSADECQLSWVYTYDKLVDHRVIWVCTS